MAGPWRDGWLVGWAWDLFGDMDVVFYFFIFDF